MRNTTRVLGLVGVALLLLQVGCNDPLRVSIPDIVQPGQLSGADALPTVRAGVLGDFGIAYTGDHPDGSGGTEGVIMYGGLLADEWIDSETFPTRIEVDARTIQTTNADVDLWFRRMHQARNSAEKAAAQFAQFAPTDHRGSDLHLFRGDLVLRRPRESLECRREHYLRAAAHDPRNARYGDRPVRQRHRGIHGPGDDRFRDPRQGPRGARHGGLRSGRSAGGHGAHELRVRGRAFREHRSSEQRGVQRQHQRRAVRPRRLGRRPGRSERVPVPVGARSPHHVDNTH